jgi:hypothetical protein
MELELKPTNQKSYYGKAILKLKENESIDLISYFTSVASFNLKNKELEIKGFYSKTTLKHIKDFINFINRNFDLSLDNTSKKALERYLKK